MQATLMLIEREFPAAMACLAVDADATLAHLRLPAAHRKPGRRQTPSNAAFWKKADG
jgi:hypothetical protein